MKILILGAAGQIGRMLTDYLLEQTNYNLILYAHNANQQLKVKVAERETFINDDFCDYGTLVKSMEGIDAIYLNDMNSREGVKNIVKVMKETGISRIIVASILGIYDKVPGAFGAWNRRMVGSSGIQKHKETAALVENPELDYTILRLTWLYNEKGNKDYLLTMKGKLFRGAQVTRQAVAQLIVDIIEDNSDKYIQISLGVGEPNTNWDKPSFY